MVAIVAGNNDAIDATSNNFIIKTNSAYNNYDCACSLMSSPKVSTTLQIGGHTYLQCGSTYTMWLLNQQYAVKGGISMETIGKGECVCVGGGGGGGGGGG